MNDITFIDSNGEEKTMHWNTRARFLREMQQGDEALLTRDWTEKVSNADYQQILNSPEMLEYTRSAANGLFGDNCAACHGSGATGKIGLFPNLADVHP